MSRLTVLVDFNALTASYNVDFRVMLRVVGLKVIGWSVNLMLDSAFKSVSDSAFDSVISEIVNEVVGLTMHLAIASLILLKLTSRLVRTCHDTYLSGDRSLG
jgi:uncharacterized protein YacL